MIIKFEFVKVHFYYKIFFSNFSRHLCTVVFEKTKKKKIFQRRGGIEEDDEVNNGIVCVLDRMSTKPKKRVNAVPYLYWYQWKQHYRAVCVLCVCVMSLCLNIVNWVDFFFVSFVWCFCVWWFGLIQFVDILEELIVNFSIKVYYFVFCVKFVFFFLILLDESNLFDCVCVSLKFSCVLNAFFWPINQINIRHHFCSHYYS